MNPWQCFRQIQATLRAEVWPDSAAVVFHAESVIVSAAPSPGIFETLMMPVAIMRPLATQGDPDHDQEPDYLRQEMGLTLAQIVAGDAVGEHALMGAIRQDDSAEGRGLMEIEEKVFDAIGIMNGLEGFSILNRFRSAPKADVGGNRYIVWKDYLFEMDCSADRSYEAAGSLIATGSVDLVWTIPNSRYDLASVVLRRAAGTTPPVTKADGAGITLGSALATSHSDTPGSGTWSYSVFMVYDDANSGARSTTIVVA